MGGRLPSEWVAALRQNGWPAWSRLRRPRCGAKTRKGRACIAKAMRNGRCRNHGGMCTGPNTEAGKQRRAEETRAWWAKWEPKARSQYMRAVAQRQVVRMRRISAGATASARGKGVSGVCRGPYKKLLRNPLTKSPETDGFGALKLTYKNEYLLNSLMCYILSSDLKGKSEETRRALRPSQHRQAVRRAPGSRAPTDRRAPWVGRG
jgi:hypothetical protein